MESITEINSREWCKEIIMRISKSYGYVTLELTSNEDISNSPRDIFCIFYLILRGLDTIEDDTNVSVTKRIEDLKMFSKNIFNPNFKFNGNYGMKDIEIELMDNFNLVINCFLQLKSKDQQIIFEITDEMSKGMILFLNKPMDTIKNLDYYSYHTSGLSGIGISRLSHSCGLESDWVISKIGFSKSIEFGLFLQKVNMIIDYKEDLNEDRSYWPKEIYSKYTPTPNGSLSEFTLVENQEMGTKCLNEFIDNTLGHLLPSLEFFYNLKNEKIINLCSTPSVVYMAKLTECYNNSNVFNGHFKFNSLKSIRIIKLIEKNGLKSVFQLFTEFSIELKEKVLNQQNETNNINDYNPSKNIISKLDEIILFCSDKIN